jgi:hypothetical protein
MLHHKYMIVDQNAPGSDPMLFTGSHNWSAAADNENDENTLIIHDATVANIYYQQFVKRFVDNMGVLFELTTPPTAVDDVVETGIAQLLAVQVLDNDVFQAPVTITVEQQATHGNAYIPFGNPNVVSYLPEAGFVGQDSAVYKITYQAAANLSATAKIYINVQDDSGINDFEGIARLNIYPNPAKDEINIPVSAPLQGEAVVKIFDLLGNQKFELAIKSNEPQLKLNIGNAGLKPGVYMVSLQDEKSISAGRLIISK